MWAFLCCIWMVGVDVRMSLLGLHSSMERCISSRESVGEMYLVSFGCVG
jgi:hypothetical protein